MPLPERRLGIDSILVLETAAELNLKDEMYIYGITATNQELAGGGMFAFVGFFDLILRQHDYNLGRQKARAFLAQHWNRTPEQWTALPSLHRTSVPFATTPRIAFLIFQYLSVIPRLGTCFHLRFGSGQVRTHLFKTTSQRVDTLVEKCFGKLEAA